MKLYRSKFNEATLYQSNSIREYEGIKIGHVSFRDFWAVVSTDDFDSIVDNEQFILSPKFRLRDELWQYIKLTYNQ